jgi:type IV pilus assembly protein PilA
MLKWIRAQLSRDEGFTLIELMVVVLIIAILIAIAIPSFIGFRDSAQDRSAQADLRSVLLAEKAHWTENSAYTVAIADLQDFEPNVNTNVTYSLAAGGVAVCAELVSDSGTYFSVWESETEATQYGSHTATMNASCEATSAALTPGTWAAGGW